MGAFPALIPRPVMVVVLCSGARLNMENTRVSSEAQPPERGGMCDLTAGN